jgi:Fe2+ or Zn2+ uptake regulation protein
MLDDHSHDYDQFATRIREQGYRMTPQRQLVLESITAVAGHATASEICDWVQSQSPAVNRATVYRTLNFLCQMQVVARFELGGATMYELVGTRPHHHLVCRGCGHVAHVPEQTMQGLTDVLQQEHGFQAEFQHVAISGLCRECAESE